MLSGVLGASQVNVSDEHIRPALGEAIRDSPPNSVGTARYQHIVPSNGERAPEVRAGVTVGGGELLTHSEVPLRIAVDVHGQSSRRSWTEQ
jgi:hypothetical protein